MNKPVFLSDHAMALAEKRAKDAGFESVDTYLAALVECAEGETPVPDWMKGLIEEGLRSGNAGPLTQAVIDRLVEEGIALAQSRK